MNLRPIEAHIDDHSPEIMAALENAVMRGAMAIGEKAVTYAKKNLRAQDAIDTGRLLNSITYMVQED